MNNVLAGWGLSNNQVFRCVLALRKFYRWLQEQNQVLSQNVLLTRSPIMTKADEDTPLKKLISPDEAMQLVRDTKDPDYAKYIILGYFFSLRPQEIFGIKISDFRLGEEARFLECTKTMGNLKLINSDETLYGKFAVNIVRQKSKKKEISSPKKNSKGWVACFSRDATRLLVSLIGEIADPASFILSKEPNQFYKSWNFEFAPKDLRRASLYWLGHNTNITIVQMMKHARQKQEKSLQLYLRRPEETAKIWTGLRVDDV